MVQGEEWDHLLLVAVSYEIVSLLLTEPQWVKNSQPWWGQRAPLHLS